MTDELTRLAIIAQLALLMLSFSFMLGAVKPLLPRHVWLAGAAFFYSLSVIAAATAINLASGASLSPGAVFSSLMLTPGVVVACWAMAVSVKQRLSGEVTHMKEVCK